MIKSIANGPQYHAATRGALDIASFLTRIGICCRPTELKEMPSFLPSVASVPIVLLSASSGRPVSLARSALILGEAGRQAGRQAGL